MTKASEIRLGPDGERLCTAVENGQVCPRGHYGRGFCRKHWKRFNRYGSPQTVHGPKEMTTLARIEGDRRLCVIVEDGAECPNEHYGLGMCSKHYRRTQRHGDPSHVEFERAPDGAIDLWIDHLVQRSGAVTECLDDWPFGHMNGRPATNGTYIASLILERATGPRPSDCECSHLCGNQMCLNPNHLAWESHIDNLARKREHGTHQAGALNPAAKLTDRAVVEIRHRRHTSDVTQRELADEYGVDRSVIGYVARGERWAHLPMPPYSSEVLARFDVVLNSGF